MLLPNVIFKKIPDKLPSVMLKTIEELKGSKDKRDCLNKAYNILITKYKGYKLRTYLLIHELFTMDLEKIWKRQGFLHCTSMNYVLKVLLIKSGFFNEEDIRDKWTLVWYISPHQYMQVRIGNEWINVDIWNSSYGIGLGDYAHGFHT